MPLKEYLLRLVKKPLIDISYYMVWSFAKILSFYKCDPECSERVSLGSTHITPRNVNFHFIRKYKYECAVCHQSVRTSVVLPLTDAMRGLKMLQESGLENLNFSGVDPFIYRRGTFVGNLIKYCKEELKLSCVTVVSNLSFMREAWFAQYGQYLDELAIACDTFTEEANDLIGSGSGRNNIDKLMTIKEWCKKYKVMFKINTVVNALNLDEDMTEAMNEINPERWQTFQCIFRETSNPDDLNFAEMFNIREDQFKGFLERHKSVRSLYPVPVISMHNNYFVLDDSMRFVDYNGGEMRPTKSILDVGVENALHFADLDIPC